MTLEISDVGNGLQAQFAWAHHLAKAKRARPSRSRPFRIFGARSRVVGRRNARDAECRREGSTLSVGGNPSPQNDSRRRVARW